MELKEAAQAIKNIVGMETVLRLYGYNAKNGFMHCPFHGSDKTASLKIYKNGRGWYCFGCHQGGSAIDFVMIQEGCDFQTAVRALDDELGLKLLKPGTNPMKASQRRAVLAAYDSMTDLLNQMISDKEHDCDVILQYYTKKQMEIEWKPKRDRTAKELTELDRLYEEMHFLEYQKDCCDELRKKVNEWRKTKVLEKAK